MSGGIAARLRHAMRPRRLPDDLVPLVLAIALAAWEGLAWRLMGRASGLDAGIAFAAIASAAIAAIAQAGLTRVLPTGALRLAVRVLALAFVLLPYADHASRKLGVGQALGPFATAAIAIGGGGAAVALLRLAWLRSALVVGAGLGAGLAVGVSVGGVERPPLAARDAHPDVLLIVMDTTRRDRLSLYGHDRPTTPNIDRFAERARIYDDAWSAAPWTPPSHASLFTGLLPAEHGVDGDRLAAFPPDVTSLPHVLQAAGYRTAGLVANPNLLGRGWSRGFDVYAPPWFEGPHSWTPWLNHALMRGRPAWLDDGTGDRILARAKRWWAAHDDAPRFLFLNFIDPHDPYHPLEQDRSRFLPGLDREASLAVEQDPQHYALDPGIPADDLAVIEALYDAEIRGLDRRLGDLFDWLGARGDLDETVVVLTADHGERLGERGLLGHLLVMDQHLLRVPLVLRHPPRVPAERVPERVQLTDVAAEVLDLAGVPRPPAFEGGGLSARVARARASEAPSLAIAQHADFLWYATQLKSRQPAFEAPRAAHRWTLIADRSHALLWSPDRAEDEATMVALEGDPSWERDLSRERPDLRKRLLEAARSAPRARASALDPSSPAPAEPEMDEALRQRLRALGYAE